MGKRGADVYGGSRWREFFYDRFGDHPAGDLLPAWKGGGRRLADLFSQETDR